MRKLWQFDGDVKKQVTSINEMQEGIFKAAKFEYLGEVDKNGKLVKEVAKVAEKKTK